MKHTLFNALLTTHTKAKLISGAMLAATFTGLAQTSYTINDSSADAMVAYGPTGNFANLNYGGAGTLAIAPASSAKGAMSTLVQFNTASAVTQFNTTYGSGNWQITGVTLGFASNFGVQGQQPNNNIFGTINAGSFGADWLSSDSWVEGNGGGNGAANGAVSYNSISGLLGAGYDSLGTFSYTPPGNNIYVSYALPLDAGLTSDAAAGGNVSLYLYAADNQISYLFNSKEYSTNHPEMILTAAPAPEPATLSLIGTALAGAMLLKRYKKRP